MAGAAAGRRSTSSQPDAPTNLQCQVEGVRTVPPPSGQAAHPGGQSPCCAPHPSSQPDSPPHAHTPRAHLRAPLARAAPGSATKHLPAPGLGTSAPFRAPPPPYPAAAAARARASRPHSRSLSLTATHGVVASPLRGRFLLAALAAPLPASRLCPRPRPRPPPAARRGGRALGPGWRRVLLLLRGGGRRRVRPSPCAQAGRQAGRRRGWHLSEVCREGRRGKRGNHAVR